MYNYIIKIPLQNKLSKKLNLSLSQNRTHVIREEFPRFAYLTSDVIVFLETVDFTRIQDYLAKFQKFIDATQKGVLSASTPSLLIIQNKVDPAAVNNRLSVSEATEDFFNLAFPFCRDNISLRGSSRGNIIDFCDLDDSDDSDELSGMVDETIVAENIPEINSSKLDTSVSPASLNSSKTVEKKKELAETSTRKKKKSTGGSRRSKRKESSISTTDPDELRKTKKKSKRTRKGRAATMDAGDIRAAALKANEISLSQTSTTSSSISITKEESSSPSEKDTKKRFRSTTSKSKSSSPKSDSKSDSKKSTSKSTSKLSKESTSSNSNSSSNSSKIGSPRVEKQKSPTVSSPSIKSRNDSSGARSPPFRMLSPKNDDSVPSRALNMLQGVEKGVTTMLPSAIGERVEKVSHNVKGSVGGVADRVGQMGDKMVRQIGGKHIPSERMTAEDRIKDDKRKMREFLNSFELIRCVRVPNYRYVGSIEPYLKAFRDEVKKMVNHHAAKRLKNGTNYSESIWLDITKELVQSCTSFSDSQVGIRMAQIVGKVMQPASGEEMTNSISTFFNVLLDDESSKDHFFKN